jgi:hypothetical protein
MGRSQPGASPRHTGAADRGLVEINGGGLDGRTFDVIANRSRMTTACEGEQMMNTSSVTEAPEATANQIRAIIGPFEDDVVMKIMRFKPTVDDVSRAYSWLRSDEYLQRHLTHNLPARAADVFGVLADEYPELGDPVL